MFPAMFVVPGLILVLALVTSVEPICSDEKVICYCGASHTTLSISCTDDHLDEHLCEMYEHCETCENDVPHCITCPSGYFGPFCDHEESAGSLLNATNTSGSDETGSRLVSRDLSCPDIRPPKLGRINCWYRDYEKECTGSCLPGHSFENGVKEIKLSCQSGVWMPYSSYPPCLSEGYCKFDLSGGGSYNCTTGGRGTYCDITCHGRGYVAGRFFCFPGDAWDPPLPYCAKAAGADGTGRDREPICECQNGGSCTSKNQQCNCPPGFQGRLCEIKEYETRRRCSQPDQVKNGEMKNTDGSRVTQNQQFYEGSSVVYSCHSEFALVGESLLTCVKHGSWSHSAPKCNSLQAPKQGPKPRTCPDPGQVANGVRRNMNKGRTSRNQFFGGSSVVFSCNGGFALLGQSMLTCTASGKWSSSLPTCRRIGSPTTVSTDDGLTYCKDPGVDPNGIKKISPWISPRSPNSDTRELQYPQGTQIEYSCKEGYDLRGENSLLCLLSGYWSSPIPTCRQKPSSATTDDGLVYCKDPGVDPNGIKTVSPWISPRTSNSDTTEIEYPEGTQIDYSCKEGYNLQGGRSILCLISGYWSSPIPKCHPKPAAIMREDTYCENPGDIRNGRKTAAPFLDPRTGVNVQADSADLPQGVKLIYSCNSGFSIRGSNVIECTSTGTWSRAAPTCEKQGDQACGHSSYALIGKILHGQKTVEGEWPWQVAYVDNRRNGMTITCGAILINHRTVLTAAHCVVPRRLDKTFLYFGKYYADFTKDDYEVLSRKASEFIVHPRYNRRNMDNDIALVRFAPEVQYSTRIQPICLPTRETTSQNMQHGAKGWVTGWGTTESGNYSDILLMAELPVVATNQCRDMYKRLNLAVQITNNMYCAGYENGEVDSCSGDSGGPMVFYNRLLDSYVLEGIVSFGVKGPTGTCGQQDRYGVYAKVSNYVPWIKQYT